MSHLPRFGPQQTQKRDKLRDKMYRYKTGQNEPEPDTSVRFKNCLIILIFVFL